jgi:hypothetical protein
MAGTLAGLQHGHQHLLGAPAWVRLPPLSQVLRHLKMGRLLLPGQLEACVLDYFARGVRRHTGPYPIVLVDKTHR